MSQTCLDQTLPHTTNYSEHQELEHLIISVLRAVQGGALVVEQEPLPPLQEFGLAAELLLAPAPPTAAHSLQACSRSGAGATGADF